MKFILFIGLGLCPLLILGSRCATSYNILVTQNENPENESVVILVHGLRASSSIFDRLEKALLDEGYDVIKVDYPSMKQRIEPLAESALSKTWQQLDSLHFDRAHIVAHSMGAILVRYYLQKHPVEQLGRVVMLSPPNQGSALVDRFENSAFFRWLNGPSGMQLGTDETDFVNQLENPNYPVGIIAGTRTINPIASLFIPGKDDGRVAIEHTKIKGMTDFCTAKTNHHWITYKESVIKHVLAFLKKGEFAS